MLKANVTVCRGSLSSHEFYALKVSEGAEFGFTLKLADRQYSRMLYRKTGNPDADHKHPEAKKFFDKLAERINIQPAVAAG